MLHHHHNEEEYYDDDHDRAGAHTSGPFLTAAASTYSAVTTIQNTYKVVKHFQWWNSIFDFGSFLSPASTWDGLSQVVAMGTASFVAFYGLQKYTGMSTMIHSELNDSLQTRIVSKTDDTHHSSNKSSRNQRKFYGHTKANQDDRIQRHRITDLKTGERVFIAGLVSIVLNWLHYRGASEMRQYINCIEREARNTSHIDSKRIQRWNYFHDHHDDGSVDDNVTNHFHEDTTETQHGINPSQSYLQDLYKTHLYYYCGTQTNVNDTRHTYLQWGGGGRWSIMRTLLNTMLGISLQFTSSSQKNTKEDPTQFLITLLKSLGFFEIFCQALHLYGWSPLNGALLAFQQLLLLGTP